MTSSTTSTVALVGSWADVVDRRRSVAGEIAVSWPTDRGRVSVFGPTNVEQRVWLDHNHVKIWPEGAFGRHFTRDEFDHAVLMLGPRYESVLALAGSSDHGCHVWLQHDVVDVDDSPIDAPHDWLSDMIGVARSVIVGSDWLAGVVRRIARDGPPVLVMPPAHPVVDPIVETPNRVVVVVGGDAEVGQYLSESLAAEIIFLDDEMTPDVTEARLLSARAGVEIRTHERGFASTTVTHMMARGIPTITSLDAHAPFADALSTAGLVVVEDSDDIVSSVVEVLRPILDDDRAWLAASTAAKTTAASWTWNDAAGVLAEWIHVVDDLDPSTVRVIGAIAS
jgi:hypothetical protein